MAQKRNNPSFEPCSYANDQPAATVSDPEHVGCTAAVCKEPNVK